MSVISAIDGVSNFFQWLYSSLVTAWNTYALIVIFVVFIGVQVAFIYMYYKAFMFVIEAQPVIRTFMKRIERFLQ